MSLQEHATHLLNLKTFEFYIYHSLLFYALITQRSARFRASVSLFSIYTSLHFISVPTLSHPTRKKLCKGIAFITHQSSSHPSTDSQNSLIPKQPKPSFLYSPSFSPFLPPPHSRPPPHPHPHSRPPAAVAPKDSHSAHPYPSSPSPCHIQRSCFEA
jgi:hypothetical protein